VRHSERRVGARRGGNRLVGRSPAPFSVVETFASVRSMILPIAEEKASP